MTDEQQNPTQEEIEELHKKWVEALRSGEYKQTQNKLHDKDGYCCLGVLCEVMGLESCKAGVDYFAYYMPNTGQIDASWIPEDDLSAFGLNREVLYRYPDDPTDVVDRKVDSVLMEMNDSGKTFAEIADYIEKELIND